MEADCPEQVAGGQIRRCTLLLGLEGLVAIVSEAESANSQEAADIVPDRNLLADMPAD